MCLGYFICTSLVWILENDVVQYFLSNIGWKALYSYHLLKYPFNSLCKFRIALHLIGLITSQTLGYAVGYSKPQTLGSRSGRVPVPPLDKS